MKRSARGLALFAAFGSLAACSSAVDSGDIEDKVREAIAAQVGAEPDSVECGDDLKAEVGATIRCTLTAEDGTRIGATVTATAVDDDQVSFDIQVDDQVQE